MFKLLNPQNLSAAAGHVTRWIIIPLFVIGIVSIGMFFISDDGFSVNLRSGIASLLFVFMAVTTLWLCSRWLDWLSKTRFKTDVAPLLKENVLALAVYYSARWIGLAFLVGTVYATVRF